MTIDSLSEAARAFYITQAEIDATHPMNDGVSCYAEDEAAMALVGERHGKRELVDLVRTLLIKAHLAQHSGGGEVVAWRYRSPAQIEFNRPWSVTEDAELVRLMNEAGGHQIEPLCALAHPRPVVPEGWEVAAAAWLCEKAEQQRKTNAKYIDHADAYPTWKSFAIKFEMLADELLAAAAPTTDAGRG